jgi:eukaryotic-like serine/threonine-protein kinase
VDPRTNDSDRNLIVGILAVQFRFATKDQLLQALGAWLLNKSQRLEDVLLTQGALTSISRTKLIGLVEMHLEQHAQNSHHSMAALDAASSIRQDIERLGDRDLHASLAMVRPAIVSSPVEVTRALPADAELTPRYQILRPHAKGGLGEVFVARDSEIQREVALKEIQLQYASEKQCQERFILEAQITGGLEHPGIVPVYGLGKYHDGRSFYAMRFIRGESFKEAIDKFHTASSTASEKSIQLRQLLASFIDVCNTMEYAHSRHVLHRDLKPSNIMLGKYGETLVVDWGLAKVVAAPESTSSLETPLTLSGSANGMLTSMGTLVGTPQFMSPEQALGQLDRITSSSDIYCLGSTLYYLLTGTPPVTETEISVILQKVRQGDIPPAHVRQPSVARSLSAVCSKAMALAPSQRYSSARELAHEIERWLADEPVQAYLEPWLARVSRWSRRNRTWTRAAAGSTLAIAIVAIMALVSVQNARKNELQALQQATEGRQAAEAGFLQARTAVDDFFTRVSETKLLKVPGLQPLRKELLVDALHYYQDFLKTHGAEPGLQAETAATYFRIGIITAEIGKKSEAMESLQQASELQQALIRSDENPSSNVRTALANTLNALGSVQIDLGHPEQALSWFQQAKDHRQIVVNMNPQDSLSRRKLLNSYDNLAIAQAMLGEKNDAIRVYEQANLERARLMADHPNTLQFRHDLARGYFNLATLWQELGEYDTAVALFRKSLELYEELQRKDAAMLEYSRELAVAYASQADCEFHRARWQPAEAYFTQATQLLESLILKNPQVTDLLLDSAKAKIGLAAWQESQGEWENSLLTLNAAEKSLQQLLQLDHESKLSQWELANLWSQRGQVLHQLARYSDSQRDYTQALQLYEKYRTPEHNVHLHVLENMAGLHIQIANNHMAQGEQQAALAAYEGSLVIWEQLSAAQPKKLEFSLQVASVKKQIAAWRMQQEQWPEAKSQLEQALLLLEKMEQGATRSDVGTALADIHSAMSQWHFMQENLPGATQQMQQCLHYRKQVGGRPEATFSELLLWAEALDTNAQICIANNDNAAAKTSLLEADRIFAEIEQKFPQAAELPARLLSHFRLRLVFEKNEQQFLAMHAWAKQALRLNVAGENLEIATALADALASIAAMQNASEEIKLVALELKPILFQFLRRSLEHGEVSVADLGKQAAFTSLHADPQWLELMQWKPAASPR